MFWLTPLALAQEPERVEYHFPDVPDVEGVLYGPTVMFVHDLDFDGGSWSAWERFFVDAGYDSMAPDWPHLDGQPTPSREPASLSLPQVVEHYAALAETCNGPVVLVGHSMGGLVVQQLAARGVGDQVVAIHAVPPHGISTASMSFLKVTRPLFGRKTEALVLAPGKPPGAPDGALEHSAITVPVLLLAGGEDRVVSGELVHGNADAYASAGVLVTVLDYSDRTHSTVMQPGWEAVAQDVVDWLSSEDGAP
ncbi:MAG: alpha/beta fold hydrolase [Proteobacteria bacterium]|nr:alpha/beta fold hydrolase [Pseudomonadota bacterium]MCP4917475.1 alpha/beta fold hydrolase [Pseudomonadota bacterium]